MRKAQIQEIIERFNAIEVRYLVVGGFAVIAHGHMRLTVDIDLVLAEGM